MAVVHRNETVGVTAVSLISAVADTNRTYSESHEITRRIVVSNEGAQIVYLGGPGVSTTNYGVKLAATTGQITLELGAGDEVWAISGTAGQTVRVLHLSV